MRIGKIAQADFQKIGNAAIDLCVFVEKLRLGNKHREEADKLTHNVLNLIKQTEKIKEEPLTKGNKMGKKLKIQFWKAEKALAMQILEQEGLPKCKGDGFVQIYQSIDLKDWRLNLRGIDTYFDLYIAQKYFRSNSDRDAYLEKAVNAITDELFTDKGELKVGEMCEVRDNVMVPWVKRKLLAILQKKYDYRFVTDSYSDANNVQLWVCAHPITKRTEPTVEECGQLVTYTWEEK